MKDRQFTDLEQEIHEAAIRETGLEDFGTAEYREGLRVLLEAFDADPQLTETGRRFAYGTILGTLVARLYAQKGWTNHPEVQSMPIRRPLVITGLPRTGTTALHKLLAVDSQFQGLEHWLTETPIVRPPRETWSAHPLYRASEKSLDAFFSLAPDMRKGHDIVADEVDECMEVLRQSFVSNRFGLAAYLPTYDKWLFDQCVRSAFRHYKDVLRLIGAEDPHKVWLLKNPGHLANIDVLLETFPDACVVQTHRDPLKAIPSLCSMCHMSRQMYEGEAARADVIGPRECTYWSRALDRTQLAREKQDAQFFDVEHEDFLLNPMGTVSSIYQYFGLTLSAETEAKMRLWIAASPTSRHGEHRYNIDGYGITVSGICEQFSKYRAQHCYL